MATAVAARARRADRAPDRPRGRRRRLITYLGILLFIVVLWEGAKFVAGTPWRAPGAGLESPIIWRPPFYWQHANDINLPHVWSIFIALGQPFQRGAEATLAEYLFGAAL